MERSAEEAKVAVVEVERVTERVIVKAAESILVPPHLHQPLQLRSHPPEHSPYLLLALQPAATPLHQTHQEQCSWTNVDCPP
ncbi:hypothetical protein SAY86_024439 [Trapa natans]|uniref:Uncharacterized protein n=1 Tax=Trapa natans TaxID=22666 RepID=A0AAN7M578_TRANT|nr:hypothetical protein SAY86_024439 [Trapa natans]